MKKRFAYGKAILITLLAVSLMLLTCSCSHSKDGEMMANDFQYYMFDSVEEMVTHLKQEGSSGDQVQGGTGASSSFAVYPKPKLLPEGASLGGIRILEDSYISVTYNMDTELAKSFSDSNEQAYEIGRASSAIYKMTLVPDESHEARADAWGTRDFAVLEEQTFENSDIPVYYRPEYDIDNRGILIGHSFIYFLPGVEMYVHLPTIGSAEEMLPYADVELVSVNSGNLPTM